MLLQIYTKVDVLIQPCLWLQCQAASEEPEQELHTRLLVVTLVEAPTVND
jgi:hypothetical protein